MGRESKEQVENKHLRDEEEDFKIEVYENQKFDDISREMFITATDFCKIVSDMFRTAFADCEGSTIDKDQQGHLSVNLFFNHTEPVLSDEDPKVHAITRANPTESNIKNDLVRRVRENDTRNKYGDRYFLTPAAMSALKEFVYDNCFKKDRSVNWGKIVSEVNINPGAFNTPAIIYTQVSLLDPIKLAEKIYGRTDENGENWVYDVRVVSMPRVVMNPQYKSEDMLDIKAVSEKEVTRLANWAGLNPNIGTINIIR